MRRFFVCLTLASVTLAVACNDDAVGPERFGSIVVRVVAADTPVAGAPAEPSPQELPTNQDGKPDLRSREGAEPSDSETPSAPARIAKSPAVSAALDRVEVIVSSGSTTRSVDLTLNTGNDRWEGTVDQLPAGTYSVVIKGYVNSEVDSYGETSGVQVRAGQTATATINNWDTFQPSFTSVPASPTLMLRFTVGFQAVSTATGYDLQVANNAGFSDPQTINTTQTSIDVGQVPGAGEYHLRVRAKNGDVPAGRWSDEAVVVVEADTVGNNAGSAAFLGFGDGINGRRETTNIEPSDDQDWYRFQACRMDTVTAETFAQRLTPASDLNTVLTLGSISPPDTVASNDDADGTDSRLDAVVLPSSGEYVVVVSGTGGTVGAYELELNVAPGEFNNGSDCIPPADHVGVTPGAAGVASLADTVRFTAVAYDVADQPLATQPTFAWGLSDSSVASIDADGLVTALADGVTDVIADVDGVSSAGTFTVAQVVTDFLVTPDSALAVSIDEQAQYAADPVDANGYTVASATVDWASDDTTVATVDAAGLATAVANGSAWLVATSGAFTDSAIFAVEQAVASITLTPDSAGLLSLAGAEQFTAEAFDANGYSLSPQPSFTWGSSDSSVATIDGTGLASAVAVGAVTISASAGGITATSTLTVEQVLASVSVTPSGQAIVTPGGTASYSAEALDSLGATVSGITFTWSSLNPEVATVDSASGLVTAVASGQALIEAEGGGIKGYGVITVGITAAPQANLFTSQATGSSAGFNLWPQAADNVWAVGHDGVILHWDGVNWNAETSNTSDSLNAAWGTSATEVFAVGNNGTVVRTDDGGSNWQPMSSPTSERLWGVWGAGPDNVFAVGTGGAIVHYDGSAWTSMTSNTAEDLRAVWGTAWDDVYAVGMNSTLMHYDGSSWGALGGAPAGGYTSIWGFGGDDYWIAGVSGLVAHYTGSWTTETIPTSSNIRGITGTASDDVYAVGGNGLVLRFDGATWDSLPAPTTEFVWDVRAAPSGDVFVGGANGVVLRGYRGAQIAWLGEPPSAVDPRTVFAASVEFRDASGAVITEPTAGTVDLGLSNNAGTVIHLAAGGSGSPTSFFRIDATTPIKGDSVLDPAGTLDMRIISGGVYDPSTGLVIASTFTGSWALSTIDPVDGTITPLATGTPALTKGLAWVNGTLWAVGGTSADVWEVDPTTGGQVSLGTVTGVTITGFNGLAVDPTDGTVYAVVNPAGPSGSQDRSLVTLDPNTYVATSIGPLSQLGVSGLVFTSDGTLLATTGTGAPIPEYIWIVDKADATMRPMLNVQGTHLGLGMTAVPAHLSGTLSAASVGGVASFGAQLDAPASGYTLVATYPYLDDIFTGSFDVNVGPAPTLPLYLDVTPNGGTITGINDTLQLQVTPYLYAGGTYQVASGVSMTWNSADSSVAIAAQDGVVTGYLAGVARIDVDEDGGNALSASVDVTVDPSFTGSVSTSTADFADQLTLTPGPGVNWTGTETVTIGGEMPYIESQDASQIVLRVPSVPIGDAVMEIGNQDDIGFFQFDTISVTSIYTRAVDPYSPGGDAARITNDTTIWISIADSMTASVGPAADNSVWTLSPSANTGYQMQMDWQYPSDLDFVIRDSAGTIVNYLGYSTGNPETGEIALAAGTTNRLSIDRYNAPTGAPQIMARLQVTIVPSVGTSMVVGYDHSCMLDLSGNAYCWGSNSSGQLGNGDYGTRYSTTPVAVTGGMTFTALTAGSSHTCGLTESGDAYCWGADWYGQIGDGAAPVGASPPSRNEGFTGPDTLPHAPLQSTFEPSYASAQLAFSPTNSEETADVMPTMVVGGYTFSQIDAGDSHTCGVSGGDIYCWGYNYYGALGDGTTTNSPSPVAVVNPGVTFTRVSAGGYHTCGLTNAGEVYCWGNNSDGEIGDGTQNEAHLPVFVGSGYTDITAGGYHTCALDGLGDVWCWGYGGVGQYGGGVYTTAFVPTAGASGYGFTRLESSAIAYSTCGVTAAGVWYCWGYNYTGQLGDGTTNNTATPLLVGGGLPFAGVAMGQEHSCGATNTGQAYCWGSWQWGELGNGASLPITPQAVTASSGFTGATAGYEHACALSGTTAYCWGYNGLAQLGVGDFTNRATPTAVSGGLAFASLSAGQYHTCGVTTTNDGYCWGYNRYGQLGDSTYSYQSAPAPVTGGPWIQIDAGDSYLTCGITTLNAAYCWGRNLYGALGTGTAVDSAGWPQAVNTGLTFEQIATGGYHACALTSTSGGAIWCWGYNGSGQLGDGSFTDSPTPVQVDNLGSLSFVSVRAGLYYTCAETTGGEWYCWGSGGNGQLGDGSYGTYSTPTLVAGTFDDVQTGRYTTCGVDAGTGYCWGYNSYGQVGNGEIGSSTGTPATVSGAITFNSVVAGGNHSCGTTAGDMYCWGRNYYGQLGTGAFQRELSPVGVSGGYVVRAPSAMPVNTSETKPLPQNR